MGGESWHSIEKLFNLQFLILKDRHLASFTHSPLPQIVLWDIASYQDHLQVNKAPDPTETRGTAANLVGQKWYIKQGFIWKIMFLGGRQKQWKVSRKVLKFCG